MKLILENVRSFVGRHEVDIAPITMLVGENSSGKTTILSILAAILHSDRFPFSPVFNAAPYSLGHFETIVSRTTARNTSFFRVGLEDIPTPTGAISGLATYRSILGQPRLAHYRAESQSAEAEITIGKDSYEATAFDKDRGVRRRVSRKLRETTETLNSFSVAWKLADAFAKRHEEPNEHRRYSRMLRWLYSPLAIGDDPISLAPIRNKPRRTYDQIEQPGDPEGRHVPLLLAQQLSKTSSRSKDILPLVVELESFGLTTGLFKTINIRRLGRRPADPFQLEIVLPGGRSNIIDVGYGVSQALPIAVECIQSGSESTILIQQPEVHLHPRAQAGLGSMFVYLHLIQKKRFAIETHSDYLVDRVRRHIGEGDITSDDVSLVFIENRRGRSYSHKINLDTKGNVTKPPASYRYFFLQEEIELFDALS